MADEYEFDVEVALSDDEEQAVAERIVRNQMEIDRLTEENDALKRYYKERPDKYPAGTKKEMGKFYVRISANRRVDDGLARRELPTNVYNKVTKKVIDSVLAKKLLPEDQYNKIVKVYENRVEVGLR